jgi:hypothetical protein
LRAANAGASWVAIAVCDFTSGGRCKREGIVAGKTSIISIGLTTKDIASSIGESERRKAGHTNSIFIVAAWRLLDALLADLAVVVSAETLDAESIFIHLITELVLRYAKSQGSEDVVWIALEALAAGGGEAVGQFAAVVKEGIFGVALGAPTKEVRQTSIDDAGLSRRDIREGSPAGGTDSIHVVAADLNGCTDTISSELVSILAF